MSSSRKEARLEVLKHYRLKLKNLRRKWKFYENFHGICNSSDDAYLLFYAREKSIKEQKRGALFAFRVAKDFGCD